MLRTFSKIGGIVIFFAAFGVGFVAWLALSSMFGETQQIKGLCFIVGGATASLLDILWRRMDGDTLNRETLIASKYGAHLGPLDFFPFWVFGLLGVIGGVFVAFTEPY